MSGVGYMAHRQKVFRILVLKFFRRRWWSCASAYSDI